MNQTDTWLNQAACDHTWDFIGPLNQLRTCAKCPVQNECRAYADQIEHQKSALDISEIYAGETPLERVRRRQGQPKPRRPQKPRRTTTPKLRKPVTCKVHGPTEDVYILTNGYGKCRPCQMTRNTEYRAKKKAERENAA